MAWWIAGIAALTWLLGRLVLGARWEGVEVAPGVWRDTVSLGQWATLWVLLGLVGLAAARRLPRWSHRVLALAPLLAWIAFSLRHGTLGPVPMVIYGLPTLVTWCVALLAGDRAWRLARAVKGTGA